MKYSVHSLLVLVAVARPKREGKALLSLIRYSISNIIYSKYELIQHSPLNTWLIRQPVLAVSSIVCSGSIFTISLAFEQ